MGKSRWNCKLSWGDASKFACFKFQKSHSATLKWRCSLNHESFWDIACSTLWQTSKNECIKMAKTPLPISQRTRKVRNRVAWSHWDKTIDGKTPRNVFCSHPLSPHILPHLRFYTHDRILLGRQKVLWNISRRTKTYWGAIMEAWLLPMNVVRSWGGN